MLVLCKIPRDLSGRNQQEGFYMLAHFDCIGGISGDMTLAAFIDLGVPAEWLIAKISELPLEGFDISESTVNRNGIQAKQIQVVVSASEASRKWAEIKDLIQNSPLKPNFKSCSLEIFNKIADAESHIHGCRKEDVHFHEIGGIDSIVDIVGTALCLDYLDITQITASKIPLGSGFVICEHGRLPLPAPATLAILRNIPVYGTDISGELVTPTGAAIIATLADDFGPIPEMMIHRIGYGAGSREYPDRPNILRVILGDGQPAESTENLDHDRIVVAEACIDDMNPEFYGYLMERLFEDGALDVYWIPVQMKKSRPGTMIQVLCPENRQATLVDRILSETTTSGVRHYTVFRNKIQRDSVVVDTVYGEIQVKRFKTPNGQMRMVPEYEVCRQIAVERDIPIQTVYETIAKTVRPANS